MMPARAYVMAVALVVATSSAFAQSATGDIQGIILDPSGKALPGVSVTVTNTATRATRETVTDSAGLFATPGLPVGPYEVEVSLQGFAIERQPNIRVHADQVNSVRLELATARMPETITIAAAIPVVESARSQASSIIHSVQLENLPLNDRNVLDLVLVTPGVAPDVRTGDISFLGQRGTLNRVAADGADNTNTFFGQSLGRAGSGRAPYQFSREAVEEIQINASGYPAQFGPAGGGTIALVTKAGSKEVRGSAFEFFRHDALMANTRINDVHGLPKSPAHGYDFGGVAGGPIAKSRHFFFASYEGRRSTQPNDVFLNLPPNTPADADTQNAIARLSPLAASWERTANQNALLARTDHELSSSQRLTLRYNHQNFTGEGFENGGTQTSFQTTGTSKVSTRSFTSSLGSVLGPSLFNDLRVHYARDHEPGDASSDAPMADVREAGSLALRIGRNSFSPRETTLDRLQLTDSLTWTRGAHKLRGGINLQFDDIVDVFPANFSGVYTFNTLAGFNRGVPAGAADTYTQAFAGAGTTGATTTPDVNEYSFFAQDEWRVNRALTMNLGLRYDVQKFADTSVVDTDTNNFGPRIGLAWAPVGKRKAYVVRGGYGIFYGRTPAMMVGAAQSQNGVNVQTLTFRGANGEPVPTYPNRFTAIPGAGTARPTIVAFDPNYQNARVQQASVGVEWEWMPHTSVSAGYLFARGRDLPRATDLNVGAAAPIALTTTDEAGAPVGTVQHYRFAPGPFTNFARVVSFQSSAESRYNGLTLELNRRFAQHHHYRIAYTLGRVIDTVPDATAVMVEGLDDRKFASNPADFEADRAPGNNDVRHRFVGSVVYGTGALAERYDGFMQSLIENWMLSAIFTVQSGQPFSAYASTDVNGDNNRFNDIAPGTTRNQFRMPGWSALDLRLARDIPVQGRTRLSLMWEAFNFLNHANDTVVNDTLYNVVGTELRRNPLFSQTLGQANPRVMQLGARVTF
jgi:hypothetical protein